MTKGTSGAQKRTIICKCGKRIIGVPNRLDTLTRLHNKVCPDGVKAQLPSTIPFDGTNISMGGLTRTNNGNIAVKNDNLICKGFVDGHINNLLVDRPDFTGNKNSCELFEDYINNTYIKK